MFFSRLNDTNLKGVYPKAVQKAFDFLHKVDIMSLTPGRHPIDGDLMYANVMDVTTRAYEGSHPEVHRNYVDLMYWPEGAERIGVAPYLGDEKVIESNETNDYALLEDVADENILLATKGCIAVFFPWDAHRPSLMVGDTPTTFRKVVIKISMKLFE